CASAANCVAGWECKALLGQMGNICQCAPAGERCNARDDDCDGIVDNQPASNQDCSARMAASVCVAGACSCSMCGGRCVDTATDANFVYVADNMRGSTFRIPIGGGAPQDLGAVNMPNGIDVDASGIYVAGTGEGSVVKYAHGGGAVRIATGQSQVADVAVRA